MKEKSEKIGLKLNIQKTKIMESSFITSWHIDGEKMETVTDFSFGAPKSLQMMTAAIKLKDVCFTLQRHYFANKGPSSQSYGFSSIHVQM